MFNTIFVPGSFEIFGQTHTRGNVMEQQPDRTRTISKYQQHHDLRSTYNNNNDNDNDNNNNNKYIIYIYMLTHLQFNLCLYLLEDGDFGLIQYRHSVKQPALITDCFGAP